MTHPEDVLLALAFDNKEELHDDIYVKLCNICKRARSERDELRLVRAVAELSGILESSTLRGVRRWHREHVRELNSRLSPILRGLVKIAKATRDS